LFIPLFTPSVINGNVLKNRILYQALSQDEKEHMNNYKDIHRIPTKIQHPIAI